ncbi:hypothetical protein G3435_07520 [Pseudomonas sp. MAFF212428]|uniref:Uncharacterized protein n=1 Tax=Pseudomonas brassicae TaxID=2708063 RepID=A0A6B3NRU1_9PSED|nr:hypothetical protein [Pseudomonas brassicae]NER59869.1 hypothetical protein [Pseudomonas brassicae]NER64839.1 hypothetical protein [Pseudomonas brassicae]
MKNVPTRSWFIKINYAHSGMNFLCMSPTIFIMLFLQPGPNILVTVVVYMLTLAGCGALYFLVVQPGNPRLRTTLRYAGLLVGQIGFWYALISFNALTDVPC